MKKYSILILGFIIIAFGVSMVSHVSYVGTEPWVAVNLGFSNISLTYGIWNALIQLFFLIVNIFIEKRPPQLGTFLNMVLVSFFVDIFNFAIQFPDFSLGIESVSFFILATIITSFGASLAIISDAGTGPKTQFYVAIHKKTKIKLRTCKYLMELLGVSIALAVGGPIFIGTIIFIIISGYFIGLFVEKLQNAIPL